MSAWTVEQEVADLVAASSVADALHVMGVLATPSAPFSLRVVTQWHRAGSETYIFVFDVDCETEKVQRLVLKACVTADVSRSLADTMSEWVMRRGLLEANGVETPRLLAYRGATLLEEWIPFTLMSAMGSAPPDRRQRLLSELGAAAAVIDSLGFPALSLHDLRSRGDDVVVIDFGDDLGPPRFVGHCVGVSGGALAEAVRCVTNCGVSSLDLQVIVGGYEARLPDR